VEPQSDHIRRKSTKKKVARGFLYLVASLIVLFGLLYGLFKIPAVQTFAARKAAAVLSKRLNTTITVESIHIGGFLNIIVNGLSIDDLHKNKILDARQIRLNIGKIKTKEHVLELKRIVLDGCDIALRRYLGDSVMNIQSIIDHLSSADTVSPVSGAPWRIKCAGITMKDCHFVLQDQVTMRAPDTLHAIDFANLDISMLNLKVSDLRITGDTIFGKVNSLSFRDHSGFELNSFAGDARVSPGGIIVDNLAFVTNHSSVDLDLAFLYDDYSAFGDFLNRITIRAAIRPSEVDMGDIAYFTTALNGMNNSLNLEGEVNGPVSNMKLRDFSFHFGGSTFFRGDIAMNGLPDITETFVQMRIDEMSTNVDDIIRFKLPGGAGNHVSIPEALAVLGNVRVNGTFTGFYDDFVSNGTFHTDVGTLTTDILLKNDRKKHDVEYSGRLKTHDFNVAKVAGLKEYLGLLDMAANITGHGLNDKTIDVKLDATVDSLMYLNHKYQQIIVQGEYTKKKFNGLLKIDDPNIALDFSGLVDFNRRVPQFNFVAGVRHAMLNELGISKRDSVTSLSFNLDMKVTGSTFDSIQGSAKMSQVVYIENGTAYRLNDLDVTMTDVDTLRRRLALRSDYLDLLLDGEIYPSDLPHSFAAWLSRYTDKLPLALPDSACVLHRQNFTFTVDLKNTGDLTTLFAPFIQVAPGTHLSGTYSSAYGNLDFTLHSPKVVYGGIKLDDYYVEGHSTDFLDITTGASRIWLKQPSSRDTLSLGIDAFKIGTRLAGDTVLFGLFWNDTLAGDHNTGRIEGMLSLTDYPRLTATITSGVMLINDSAWSITPENRITVDSTALTVSNLSFKGQKAGLVINGAVSDNPSDHIMLQCHDLDIAYFDPFIRDLGFDIRGFINGQVNVSELFHHPDITGKLLVDDFNLNGEHLGDLSLNTGWDKDNARLMVNADILYHGSDTIVKTMTLNGSYYSQDPDHAFDLTATFYNYKLHTLYPFFSSFLDTLNGYATGTLFLTGSRTSPQLTGSVKVRRTEFRINFLNTLYSISDNVEFGPGYIGFDNMTLYDTAGHMAKVNGKIYHKLFQDLRLDLEVTPFDFIGMSNTAAQSPLFYGVAVATGTARITGPVDDILLDVKARTDKGTRAYIPISYAADVSDNDYIHFVTNRPDTTQSRESVQLLPVVTASGFALNFDLNVTDDASIQIFLPMQMGNIRVSGDGLVKLGLNSKGDFTINGIYTMNDGSFLFSMKNLINRTFSILGGSTIAWTGDLYDARVNIRATYQVRPKLGGLPTLTGDTSLYDQRVPVDCIIRLTGNLFNPDIRFSLDMPDASDEVKSLVYNAIDTTNEVLMTQQMISLLVLNSFSFSTTGGSVASSMGLSTYDIIANQLSNWLSQISEQFDIGVNYKKGTTLTPEQVELALSTQLFNDRVYINSAFGVGTYGSSAGQASQLVGDVLIEVKITPDGRFRGRAYNKTNTGNLLNDNTPYTQGVGLSYSKDFNNFGDLFHRKRKKTANIIPPVMY